MHTVPQPPGQPASRPQANTPLEQAGGVHMMIGDGVVPGVEVNVGAGVGPITGDNPRSMWTSVCVRKDSSKRRVS